MTPAIRSPVRSLSLTPTSLATDRVLLGSDWPHPERLASPREWIGDFVELGDADMRKALRDNLLTLSGY